MYKQYTIALLSITNFITLFCYYNEYKYKNEYKLKLKGNYNKYDDLLTQYYKSKKDLEELAIKMKKNDYSDIDIDKYIDLGCEKCQNDQSLNPYMRMSVNKTFRCCKTCLRCHNCGKEKNVKTYI